jgi:hypothetical protein
MLYTCDNDNTMINTDKFLADNTMIITHRQISDD